MSDFYGELSVCLTTSEQGFKIAAVVNMGDVSTEDVLIAPDDTGEKVKAVKEEKH